METEKSPFKEYELYITENGKMSVNTNAIKSGNEAFELFKELYDTHYGTIEEDENLISIHTGGWSENEHLISMFKNTGWWHKYIKIEASGGHYFFNTDIHGEKEWKIIKD